MLATTQTPRWWCQPPQDPGSPPLPQQLPTRSEFGALLQAQAGPIKSVSDARWWLDSKGWVLAGEPYDRMKLARVLMTAAVTAKGMKIKGDARNAILAVALLLESNIIDSTLKAIANAVASKILKHVKPVVHHMASSADFTSANGTAQAETTLALKGVSAQLESITSSLGNVILKLSALPSPTPSPTPPGASGPSWADIARSQPLTIPSKFNPGAPPQHIQMQQQLLHDAKTILIMINTASADAPGDYTPTANFKLCSHLNKMLAEINKSGTDLAAIGGVPPPPLNSHLRHHLA
ncbi:hypothetical protein C0993_012782 [Termitomyces sp. T159_Od127]|nr:hypothetical protein C0993_012782 [Termitomyces sp. T159_Od127]